MQQKLDRDKAGRSRIGIFVGLIGFALVGGVVVVMMTDIPAKQKPVEKELDGKTFLGETKQ